MGDPKRNDGSIMRSDLDGKNMMTIVPPGGTFTPKQLQMEKRSGKLYWSDRAGMRVMRANLDGRKSRLWWIRVWAIRGRDRIRGNGASALRWTRTAAGFLGNRRVVTTRVWVESFAPTA